MTEAIKSLKKEDLTPDLMLVADICGMGSVRKLIKHFSGTSFYVPKISHFENFILKYIDKNRTRSLKELAKELNVSEQHLKNLTRVSKDKSGFKK